MLVNVHFKDFYQLSLLKLAVGAEHDSWPARRMPLYSLKFSWISSSSTNRPLMPSDRPESTPNRKAILSIWKVTFYFKFHHYNIDIYFSVQWRHPAGETTGHFDRCPKKNGPLDSRATSALSIRQFGAEKWGYPLFSIGRPRWRLRREIWTLNLPISYDTQPTQQNNLPFK